MSIVFDRAVEYYDKTRALPENLHRDLIDSFVASSGITPDSRVLEVGIGTGRIAMSVSEHVRRVFGIDLSVEMMTVLQNKLRMTPRPISLAQANALSLPFAENTFDVVYAVHVYHLVHNWRDALQDARRVLKMGGKFVVNFHKRDESSPNMVLRQRIRELAREQGVDTRRPGAQSEQEIQDEILRWDDAPRTVHAMETQDNEVPAAILEELDRQIFSETWMIPREVMDKMMPMLRAWASEYFGDLHHPVSVLYSTRWLIAEKK